MASMYVQKYTRKPKSQAKDEFFVNADKFSIVGQFKNKIERMYNVEIHFEKKPSEGGHWMLMDGEPVDRRNAKNYIKAICHPEEMKQVKFPASTFKEFSDIMTLESIEKSTNAVIRPLKDVATYEIGGTELGVTLALSRMEEIAGSLHVDPNETVDEEVENDENIFQISPGTNNASKRLSSQLERALSENSDGICSIEDYKYAPPSVKRVLVNCLADNELDNIDEDLLFSEGTVQKIGHGKEESVIKASDRPSYIRVYSNEEDVAGCVATDGERGTNMDTSATVGSLSYRLHETSLVSNESVGRVTKQQSYLKTFGISVGYSEDKVKRALNFVDEKTRPSDFLDILNGLNDDQSVETSSPDKGGNVIILSDSDTEADNTDDDDDEVIILETETIDMETGKGETIKHDTTKQKRKNSVQETLDDQRPQKTSCQGLPDKYRELLKRDFLHESDNNLSVDELKRRNAERQMLLKENLQKQKQEDTKDGNSTQTAPKKKGKKKKKNKQSHSKQQQQQQQTKEIGIHDNQTRFDSGENKTYSQDEEQTCVMKIWDQIPTVRDCTPYQNPGHFELMQSSRHIYRGHNSQSEVIDKRHNLQHYSNQGMSNWSQPLTSQDFRHNSPNRSRQSNNNQYSQNSSPQRPSTSYGHGKPTQVVTPNLSGPAAASQSSDVNSDDLRYIVIDGSNVAMTHGNGKCFSCKGLRICVDYFKQRGHKKITVFVPQWRTKRPCDTNPVMDQNILHELKEEEILVFTPSRRIGGKLVAAYDDRFVMELAEAEDGVIVSNDQYRDLMLEKHSWRKLVEERLLMYSFVKDRFMVPNDPMGRDGPCLDDFLRKTDTSSYSQGTERFHDTAATQGHYQGHQGHFQGYSQGYQGYLQHNEGQFQFKDGDFPRIQDQGYSNEFHKQSPNQKWKGHAHRPHSANQYQGLDAMDGGHRNKSPCKSVWQGNKVPGIPINASKIRSDEETEKLLKELRIIFPEPQQEDIIRKILANHDKEMDLMKLTNYCMSVFFT